MALTTTGTIWNSLKLTLNKVLDDKTDNVESSADYKDYMDERKMVDHWEEDLEMAGPGFASQKAEGAAMSVGELKEGYKKRYIARTFALQLNITEEAIEDKKYDQAVRLARRLKRSMFKTAELDCAQILVRGFNSSYTGGDGVPLWSASHPLAHGGTASNVMATAMAPSRAAMITLRSQVKKLPGHDGITEGYMMKAIVCPTEQESVWEEITGSKFAPEAGEFNRINVVNKMTLKIVPLKFWNNTTTNWGVVTDCENGFNIRWKRKPRSRTWMTNNQEIMSYGISARWDNGWSNWRCTIGSQA